jgi:hypothetical protein
VKFTLTGLSLRQFALTLHTVLLLVAFVFAYDQVPCPASTKPDTSQFTIDADYPGGNIIVERIDVNEVRLRQDLRDTQGWWFYWSFRIKGAADRTLKFTFTDRNPIGVRGPALSLDEGKTWSWLGADKVKGASFTYAFGFEQKDVRFCFAIPYQQADLDKFLKRHSQNPHLSVHELCKTRRGRTVERIHLGRINGPAKHRILLTARHHACESIANYVMEGLLESILAQTEDGQWFRSNVEFLVLPFMDKDGVEEGDQGKNRSPHDHNRDYAGKSIYPSVAALRKFVPNWSQGRLHAALDLHCPYISGPHNEVIYLVGSANKNIRAEQQKFSGILEDIRTGPLLYKASDNLPFGKGWNTDKNYGKLKSSSRWASEIEQVRLAATIEIPYANVHGETVTTATARDFGRDLARAIRKYLESTK